MSRRPAQEDEPEDKAALRLRQFEDARRPPVPDEEESENEESQNKEHVDETPQDDT